VIARVTKLGQPVHLTGFAAPISTTRRPRTALVKQYRGRRPADSPRGHRSDLNRARPGAHIDSQGEAVVEMGGRRSG